MHLQKVRYSIDDGKLGFRRSEKSDCDLNQAAHKREMAVLGRRLAVLLKSPRVSPFSSSAGQVEEGKGKGLGRKAVALGLLALTGGVAVSALDDLVIFYRCSSKAMEKASKDQRLVEAIGEPIERGPWYNASIAVAHQKRSVSCTFPVSGSRGTGIFQLKAVRNDDDDSSLLSFFRPGNWDVLMMEALLHAPGNDEKNQTFRISISEQLPPADCQPCAENKRDLSQSKTVPEVATPTSDKK
uniref:Uncharacterized protein n=1 Tax=Kalanchoe fedtschenkoi TaxID=63787 RepID=A0A7N0ZVK7_KALFE